MNRNSNNKAIDYYQTFYPLSFITDIKYKLREKLFRYTPLPVEHEFELETFNQIRIIKSCYSSIKKLSNQKIVNNLSYQHGWTVAVFYMVSIETKLKNL